MYKKISLLIIGLSLWLINNSIYADGFNNYIHFANINDTYHMTHNINFLIKVRDADGNVKDTRETDVLKPGGISEISENGFSLNQGTIDIYVADKTNFWGERPCILRYPYTKGEGIIVQGWGENYGINCTIADD